VKKLLIIVLTLVLSLSLAIPAVAADGPVKDADTSATVSGGTTHSPPIVKCKWETSGTEADSENGDPTHLTLGTQIDPVIDEDAQTCVGTVYYWAFVTDPQGVADIREVCADVWEPGDDPDYVFKYKVEMPQIMIGDWQGMKDALTAADAADLVTYAPGYDLNELVGTDKEIDQHTVLLFRGMDVIEGHQPGGIYHVDCYAYDQSNELAAFLTNCFEYVRTEALVKDFTEIDWEEVNVCQEKVVCGDQIMYENDANKDGYDDTTLKPNLPTLKSTGNCNLDISVYFSEMVSATRPIDEVEFDAYLESPEYKVYPIPPETETDISNGTMLEPPYETFHTQCPQCTPTKLGLSIHVIQAMPDTYTGTVTITGSDNDEPWAGTDCSNADCARGHG
jgi:hypothetical protein